MKPSNPQMITAQEIASYVVCPEAWRLKRVGQAGIRRASQRTEEVQRLKQEWVLSAELSTQLRHYAKWIYALLVIFVGVLFIADRHLSDKLRGAMREKLQVLQLSRPRQ